ncbi:hypothetical protein Hanom_Chr06g00496201 [Helianthus anomalus]
MLAWRELNHTSNQWRSLKFFTGRSKTYIPKKFYRIGGSKTYIPKNFYTKTTYITLLAEKFGGSGAPPGPFKASPLLPILPVHSTKDPFIVSIFPLFMLQAADKANLFTFKDVFNFCFCYRFTGAGL